MNRIEFQGLNEAQLAEIRRRGRLESRGAFAGMIREALDRLAGFLRGDNADWRTA